LSAYTKSHAEDMARMQTTVGPHRDDIVVHDRGVDLGSFGSRGQQRSTVLALKMAEVAVMHARSGERPILLLDDVLSELDALRRMHILALIAEPSQQSILTATGVGDFTADFLATAHVLRVDHGHVSAMS
jgi:DNA replication and repair protein RecF